MQLNSVTQCCCSAIPAGWDLRGQCGQGLWALRIPITGQAVMTLTTQVDSKPFAGIPESSDAVKTRGFSGLLTDLEVRPTFCRTTDFQVRQPTRYDGHP
jgi:hypothetical protein